MNLVLRGYPVQGSAQSTGSLKSTFTGERKIREVNEEKLNISYLFFFSGCNIIVILCLSLAENRENCTISELIMVENVVFENFKTQLQFLFPKFTQNFAKPCFEKHFGINPKYEI